MAELAPRLRIGPQLAAIAAVRWRLAANGLRTTRGALELISRLWIGLCFAGLGLGGAAGFGFAGWYFLHRGQPEWAAVLLWPLFAFWQVFPLASSAFTEQADTSNLARFPLSYPAYFLVRVAFGTLDVTTLVGCCCTLGLVVGLGLAAPPLLPWTVLGAALFVVFNIVLAQAIFAWLERWLARRRTREILALIFFLAIFSVNFIGPLTRRWHTRGAAQRAGVSSFQAWIPIERWLPPGLPAHTLAAAARGHLAVAASALLLLAAWGAGTLALLHLRLQAEFRGENWSEAAAPRTFRKTAVAMPAAAVAGRPALSGLAGPVAAIAQKELRYLFRSPMMLLSLVMPVLLLILFRTNRLNSAHAISTGGFHFSAAGFGFPIGVAYALLVLANLTFNAFGTDDRGIQLFFVSPVRFRQILMGKNLAYALVLTVETAVIFVAAIFIDGPPSAGMVAATLLGLIFGALCDFSCGNLLSLYLPKKIDLSRLGRQGGRSTSGMIALAVQGVLAGVIALAVLSGVVWHRRWLTGLILVALAAIAAVAYRLVLDRIDPSAQARRETLISELSKA